MVVVVNLTPVVAINRREEMENYILLAKMASIKWLKYVILSVSVFILPIKPMMAVIGLMVVIDTVLGIIKSNKAGIKFSSRRFFALFKKTLVYQLALLTTFCLDWFILSEITLLFISVKFIVTKALALAIVFNELKSINENLEIAYKINLFDYIKDMFRASKDIKEGFDEIKP